jgi:glycosyltransferase involved in cell wall biosynthesis
MPPLVSIIIPCHNAGPTLAATLASALGQTWTEKEVIVVNDGSTDDTRAIAGSSEPAIRIVDQPQRGASAARNAGLAKARGSFIQFLDADDLLAPDKVARQLEALESRGTEASVASGEWARFTGDPSTARFAPRPLGRNLTGIEFLQVSYEEGDMMHPAAWLAPRRLLDRAGPWNESLSLNDDGEYFARVALASREIVFCPGARSYYRSGNPRSLSGRRDARALDSLYRSMALTLAHLLAADSSARSRAAAAYAWKWTAFELFPGAPQLAKRAERQSRELGGSARPFPAGGRFQVASRILGWRLAKRLFI